MNKPLSGLGWRMKLFMKIQNKNLWNIYGSLMDIFDLKNLWTFLTKKYICEISFAKPETYYSQKRTDWKFHWSKFPIRSIYIYYRCGLALIFFCEGV